MRKFLGILMVALLLVAHPLAATVQAQGAAKKLNRLVADMTL